MGARQSPDPQRASRSTYHREAPQMVTHQGVPWTAFFGGRLAFMMLAYEMTLGPG
ncbi:hypothetical protein L208DRAFT_1388939 [Tricholoma matsutake]|nr:hypothetical protein L208DRAFT_1388939 [Tricholoma matsutake 945]